MKSDKRQSMVLIGIGLIIIAAVLIVISVSQPRVYESSAQPSNPAEQVNKAAYSSSDANNDINDVESIFPININTASLQELMAVEGLGESRANAIIEYREAIGGYTDVSQIMDISGFGESLYEQVAPYLTV